MDGERLRILNGGPPLLLHPLDTFFTVVLSFETLFRFFLPLQGRILQPDQFCSLAMAKIGRLGRIMDNVEQANLLPAIGAQ